MKEIRRELLRNRDFGRTIMISWIKKKYKFNPKHPMLFTINTIDINNEAERLKNN